MTNYELNKYIQHYLENDKTHSAIMLTGEWGSGKSYYIQHELIPFLNSDGPNRCVTVSLYGLSEISEVSKNIYLEMRIKNKPIKMADSFFGKLFKNHAKEIVTYGKLAGATLLKGLFNRGGLELNAPDSALEELYHSIDLTGKLLIIEDAERSKISIPDLLGYINSLVETDSVKVLIVANEDAILTYEESEPDEDGKTHKIPTKETVEYLKTKEKTISDTIIFEGDQENAIRNIIRSFENLKLSRYDNEEAAHEISILLSVFHCRNLRTFTYACQKTADIYDLLNRECDTEQLDCIFFSIMKLSCQIKNGVFPSWIGTGQLSIELSNERFPLYRFCYDYIRWQTFDHTSVEKAFDEHKKYKLYDKNGGRNDADLSVLGNYYVHPEEIVLNALSNIERRLDNAEDIPFYKYGELAIYLVQLHTILAFDYDECKRKMVENIRGRANDVDGEILFLFGYDSFTDDEREQYKQFQEEIITSLNSKQDNIYGFQYSPDQLAAYYKTIAADRSNIKYGREFVSRYDIDKLVDMLVICNAAQIRDFRDILFAIYRNATRNSFVAADVDAMMNLQNRLIAAKKAGRLSEDRIINLQMDYLISNLGGFIKQLS